jgi:hypothetical protein
MKVKTVRMNRPGRDYAMIAAIVAIALSAPCWWESLFAIRGDLSQAKISQPG